MADWEDELVTQRQVDADAEKQERAIDEAVKYEREQWECCVAKLLSEKITSQAWLTAVQGLIELMNRPK